MLLQGLLRFKPVKDFIHAPDIGKFVAVGKTIVFENAKLARLPDEPDPTRVDTLVTLHSVKGNMGTMLSAEQLAPIVAAALNKVREAGRRELNKGSL